MDLILPDLISHVYWKQKEQFQRSQDTNPHWVLFALEQGEFFFQLKDQEGVARSSDLLLCPPRTLLRRSMVKPSSFHFIQLQWKDMIGNLLTTDPTIPIGKFKISNIQRLHTTYSLLRSLKDQNGSLQLSYKNHLLQDIWLLYQTELSQTQPLYLDSSEDSTMNEVKDYLQQQACSKIYLKELSSSIHLSPVQLTRRFRTAFGITPVDYITTLRLEKAKHLLTETELTLAAIAMECGYENEFYLSRVFTKKVKINPSTYRKIHQI